MGESLGEAVLTLSTDDRKYTGNMDRAQGRARLLDRVLEQTGRQATTLGTRLSRLGGRARVLSQRLTGLRSAAAAAAGAAGLFLLAKRAIQTGDEIAKTARAIGVSAEALQEYRFAAGRAGIATAAFDSALGGFSKRVGEARNDTGSLTTILKNLDPILLRNVQAANSVEEAFDIVVDAAARMGNQLDRNALLAAAFGRTAGIEMNNMIQGGVAAIDRLRERARELGVVLSEDVTRRAEQAADELGDMEQVLKVAATSAGLELMPAMRMLAQALTDPEFIKALGEISRLMTRFIIILVQLKDVLVPAVAGLIAFGVSSRVTKTQWAALMAVITAGLAVWLQNQDGMSNTAEELDALTAAAVDFVAQTDAINESQTATEDSVRALADALRMETTQMEQLIDRYQFGADAVAELRRELELENAATAANISFATEQGQRWAELFRRGQDLRKVLGELEEGQQRAADSAKDTGRAFGSAFESAILGGERLRDVLQGLLDDLIKIALRAFILGPIERAIGSAATRLFPGGGASSGSSVGGGASAQPTAMARGGQLGARQPAIVGEKGIELFVPDVAGSVIPNNALGSLGGGVVVNVNIDGQRAEPDSVSDGRSADGRREIEVFISDTVSRDIARNGPVGRAIAGTFSARRQGIR